MIAVTFTSKDQNWQDGTTTYWFVLDGTDYGAGCGFDHEMFGIVDDSGNFSAVESDGTSIQNDHLTHIILRYCKITAKIIDDSK